MATLQYDPAYPEMASLADSGSQTGDRYEVQVVSGDDFLGQQNIATYVPHVQRPLHGEFLTYPGDSDVGMVVSLSMAKVTSASALKGRAGL